MKNSFFREFLKEYNVKWEPISTKNLKNDAIPTYVNKVNKVIRQTLANKWIMSH